MGWKTETMGNETRELCRQGGSWSCQIASIATVINRYGGGQPTETAIIQRSREHAGGYKAPVQERPGFQATPMASEQPTQPSHIGTYTVNMEPTLKAYKIVAKKKDYPNFKELQKALDKASQKSPVILQVPQHIIVCDGKEPRMKGWYVICDPGPGLLRARIVKADPPILQYRNSHGDEYPITAMWTTKQDDEAETTVKVM
jgi:hypothetical protein